ncbi:Uncharacterised protein [Serratia liquefaciens]|nr:Uncharacterised protein [Serratia liquefaciens]
MVPGPQQLRPGATVVVRLDVRRGRQPFRLTQTAVQRVAQVAAVVDLCRSDIRVDLPRQLAERLPRFPRRTGVEDAFKHRITRRQRICRCRHRPLVLRCCHAGETGVITADVERYLIWLIGQSGPQEGREGRCGGKLPTDTLLGGENVELPADQTACVALRKQIDVFFLQHRHLTAADRRRSVTLDPIALAVRRHFHRVTGAWFEADVTSHVQRADRIARRHGTASARGQRTQRTGTAQHAGALHRHVRSHRTIYRQQALIDQGWPCVAVIAGQHQCADAQFGQAAMAGNIVAPDIQPTMNIVTHTLGRFAFVQYCTDAWQIHHKLLRAVGTAHAELLRDILFGDKHPRAVDRFAQINHPPAVKRIDARRAHINRGGLQHRSHLCAGHIGEAFHQHCNAACHVRCGH